MARAGLVVLLLLLLGLLSTSLGSRESREGAGRRKEMEPREREEEQRRGEHERGRGRGGRGRGEEEPQIELGRPQEMLQSEGGRLRIWSEEIDAIRNSHVGIGELELEQNGLLVPQYTDADKIAYVLQGCGKMGAVIPGAQSEFRRTYVRSVRRGDVIALPKGTVYWWYNDGNERHRVLCAGDTNLGANPGRFHQFGLAGSKQARFGSVLHGFSKDTLATAWGVDQKAIESLLEGQNDAGIVKAKQKIHFPQMPERSRREEEEEERSRREEEEERNSFRDRPASAFYFEELKYSIRDDLPDFYVENGGTLNKVNCHKLPALRQVGFSAVKVKLEKNAMAAPLFVRNAHQLIYFTRGTGRVQVASGDGKNVFDQDVREGTVLAIPQFFPSLKIAGDQGLEWINLLTSDSPSTTYLAGRNSVYRGIPKQVIAAAFNVDEEKLRELGRDEEVIFPASKRGGRGRGSRDESNGGGKGESEEQRRRREQEEEQQRRRRQEEEERRRREEEERRRREEEEERRRHPREHEEKPRSQEEQRRQREREEEERRKHQRELPAWALASLEVL